MSDDLRVLANRMLEEVKAQSEALHLICDLVSFMERRGIAYSCDMEGPGQLRLAVTIEAATGLVRAETPATAHSGVNNLPPKSETPPERAMAQAAPAPAAIVAEAAVDTPAPPAFRTGPYTDEEVRITARMLEQGKRNKEIAKRLNRDWRGIHGAIARAQKLLTEAAPPAAPKTTPAAPIAAPKPQPAPVTVQPPAEADPAEGKGGIRRKVAMHLDACHDDAWPPAKDLAMARAIVRGEGIAGAAFVVKTPSDDCRKRWARLSAPVRGTNGLTLDGQAALLEELRKRAGREERIGT